MEGATCYAKTTDKACSLEMIMINSTSTYSYYDVAIWHDDCIASGNECRRIPGYENKFDGTLTYVGHPHAVPGWRESSGWMYYLQNNKIDKKSTITGNHKMIYYDCKDWEGSYRSKNVSTAIIVVVVVVFVVFKGIMV